LIFGYGARFIHSDALELDRRKRTPENSGVQSFRISREFTQP
jgi:hypothetical protein